MPDNLPPETAGLAIALSLVVFAGIGSILFVGPAVWYVALLRLVRGEPIVEHEPRRIASWGAIDGVAFLVLLVLLSTAFAALLGVRRGDAFEIGTPGHMRLILAGGLGQVAACVFTAAFIWLRTGCTFRDLGFSLDKLGYDLLLGYLAFCALAIPTYLTQAALTQFWPSEHPLLESLKEQFSPEFVAVAVFLAVVNAPLTEEIMFRLLLQGWLERLTDSQQATRPGHFQMLLLGERVQPPPIAEQGTADQPLMAEIVDDLPPSRSDAPRSESSDVLYLGPESNAHIPNPHLPTAPTASETTLQHDRLVDVLAIGLSSILFSLAHFTHGPDWISLLFLAVGLGYLYRRTHRITPCIVVHFLVNGLSMSGLVLQLLIQQE